MAGRKGMKHSAEGRQKSKETRAAHRAKFGGTPSRKGVKKKPVDYQGAGYDMIFGFDFTIRYRQRRGGSPHLYEEICSYKDD